MGKEWGLMNPSLSYGGAYADLDLDGDLDLVVNNVDDYVGIFQNTTMEAANPNHFLKVSIVTESGRPAYGSRVSLYQQDSVWQIQELTNSRGYMSKSEDVLHFGLGKEKVLIW